METEVEVDGVHPVEGDGDGKKIIKLRDVMRVSDVRGKGGTPVVDEEYSGKQTTFFGNGSGLAGLISPLLAFSPLCKRRRL